jgi:predicted deacetylase
MKVAIRDDDACYFTTPEALERVYHDIWDTVPVCLAAVPFAVGYERKGIPREHWSSSVAFPLDRNPEVVAFLRQQLAAGKVSVALHGFTHEDFASGYEFQACPDPDRRVREGLRYLQDTLNTTVSIFVPPHNALSKRSLQAVDAAGLNLLGSFLSFRPSLRPWDVHTPANWWRVRRFRAATARTRRDRFIYPFVLRYRNHREFGCHSLIPGTTFEEMRRGLDEARAHGGDFCIATHYWEVDGQMKEVLKRTLDYAAGLADTRFVAAEALFA